MRNYYVYWVTLVFIDGTNKTVRFTAKNDRVAEAKVKALPKFETIVKSFIVSKDSYRQAA